MKLKQNLTILLGLLIVSGIILCTWDFLYNSRFQLRLIHNPSALSNATGRLPAYMSPIKTNMIRTSLPAPNTDPPERSPHQRIKIGIVKPTFTFAAYNNAFYEFYGRHGDVAKLWRLYPENPGCCVKTDLNLLTGKIPPNTTLEHYWAPHPFDGYKVPTMINHIKKLLPMANVAVLTDGDIHEGIGNSYDILLLGHQEYVTQQEYENLQKFVENGGMLVLLDGNVFYAEVTYNKAAQTVTLVNGHEWAFDGKTASRGTNERWLKETSQWIGSNYYYWRYPEKPSLPALIFNCSCAFRYQVHEEQYITNPNVKVLRNYDTQTTIPGVPTPIIATYEKYYGNGKIIVLGIYSDKIIYRSDFFDTVGFLNFFDEVFKSAMYNRQL